jgi:hypothetical protein
MTESDKYYVGFEFSDEDGEVYVITDILEQQSKEKGEPIYRWMQKRSVSDPRAWKGQGPTSDLDRKLEIIQECNKEKQKEAERQKKRDAIFYGETKPFDYRIELENNPYKGKSYIAKIVGLDPQFKFDREFVRIREGNKNKRDVLKYVN